MNIKKPLTLLSSIILSVLIPLLSSCNDDPASPAAEYVVLGNQNFRAKISLYDHNAKSIEEVSYTPDSQFANPISNAAKKDQHVVLATAGGLPKLVKFDINTGAEVKSIDSWIYSRPFIGFYNENVIVCTLQNEGSNYSLVSKIYTDDLILLDSIADTDVVEFHAATIVGNELYYSVSTFDSPSIIKAKNLNTKQTRSVETLQASSQLLSIGTNKLLAISGGKYFTIDTETMSVLETITAAIEHANFDANTNTLFYLAPAAQPALTSHNLSKLDLLTGEKSILATNESFGPPLLYDPATNLIICGGLRVFSKTGQVLDTQTISGTTTHIFKK